MPASYPGTIKIWSPTDGAFQYPEDLKTVVYARHVVTIYDEVTAIQQELGALGVKSGVTWGSVLETNVNVSTNSFTSLRARLANIDAGLYYAFTDRVKTSGASVIQPTEANKVGLTVTAHTSQSVNLFEAKVGSTAVTSITKDGWIEVIDGGEAS
jgi:hypothetical protein